MDKMLIANPLHIQVRDEFVKRIANGVWKVGGAIPNEIELSQQLNVSAGTVRKALDWMEHAKLLVRKQGRGTFVLDPNATEITKRYHALIDLGSRQVLATRVLQAEYVKDVATEAEARKLQLDPGTWVHRIFQLKGRDKTPLSWKTHALPVELFPQLSAAHSEFESINPLALSLGVVLGTGREVVQVGQAQESVATALNIPKGTALLSSERLIETVDGVPAVLTTIQSKPEGIGYEAILS